MIAPTTPAAPPTVSVVIPCYKQGHLLPEAVASVLAQTFTDWECIIVDDGSPDDAGAVADALARQHPARIRVIHQNNRGLSEARNTAVRASRGRYILPLDSDDRLAPDMLAKTVAVLEADPRTAIVHTHIQHFGVRNDPWPTGPLTLANEMQANFIPYCSLYRRAVWDAVGGYNPNLDSFEDWDFWIGALERGFRGVCVPEPLFHYRTAATSMLTEANKRYAELYSRIILNHPDLYAAPMVETARRKLAEAAARGVVDGRKPLSTVEVARPRPEPLVPLRAGAPLVSVIITTLDRPALLLRAVKSVLAQTLQDFEIIVVNDGGGAVEPALRALDPAGKIQVVSAGRTRGLPAARNLGLRIARGQYVAYLDDDDLFYPHHLERLVGALASGAHKVVYSDAERLHTQMVADTPVVTQKDVPYSIDFDRNLLLAENITPVLCVMHERALLDEVGLFDESMGVLEDWELWLRLSARYPFRHVAEVTCAFTHRTDGATMTFQRQELFGLLGARVQHRHGQPAVTEPFVPPAEMSLVFLERTASAVLAQAGGPDKAKALASSLEERTRGGGMAGGDGHHDLALVYLALGRPADAEATLRAAAAVADASADVRMALVHFCLAAGRVDEAIKQIERILTADPQHVEALLLAGDASLSLGRDAEAADFYRAARSHTRLRRVADARLHNLRARQQTPAARVG